MFSQIKKTPNAILWGTGLYLALIIAVGGYLSSTELQYAIPLVLTGLAGAFFTIYKQGRLTIVSALLGLIFNLVLLFGIAAEDIFTAIQLGNVPNLHYGLPLVAGLFGYLLGQVNHLLCEEKEEDELLFPHNVRMMRPSMPTDKDLAMLESKITSTVSSAIAQGISDGITQGLQSVFPAQRSVLERKKA